MSPLLHTAMLFALIAISLAIGYLAARRQPVGFRLPNRNRRKMEDSHYTWFLVRTPQGRKWMRLTDEAISRAVRDGDIDPSDQPWKL